MASTSLIVILTLGISSSLSASDSFNCFLLFANHYLEKSGTTVTRNVSSVAVCLDSCIEAANFGTLPCRSVMWKKTTNDCILSRWNISKRPKHVRISQRMDVDFYENTCFGEKSNSTIYTTSEHTMARTTTIPRSSEDSTTRPIITPSPGFSASPGISFTKVAKMNVTSDFRRFRAHHARSLSGTPLAQQAFHRVDGESEPPLSTSSAFIGLTNEVLEPTAEVSFQMKPNWMVSTDEVTISSQLDDPSFVQSFGKTPIRKGTILPHSAVPIPTRPPAPVTSSPLPTPSTPFVVQAPPLPCFVRVRGYYLANFEEHTLSRSTLTQCLLSCLKTTSFFCASVNYQESQRICTLNGGNAKLNNATLTQLAGLDYFENRCHLGDRDEQLNGGVTTVASAHTKGVTIPACFEQKPNMVLASLDALVVMHLRNLGECVASCTASPVPCSGMNWIPSTNGCMLFHGDVDLSQLAEASGSSFYANSCTGKVLLLNKKVQNEKDEEYYDHDS